MEGSRHRAPSCLTDNELALRSAQKNHGTRNHEFLGCRIHGVLECSLTNRLERCCRRPITPEAHPMKITVPGIFFDTIKSPAVEILIKLLF